MQKSDFKVAVILPIYNGERGFDTTCIMEDAIESILEQQCGFPFLLILVNDGSTDRTESVIDHYASSNPYVQQLNFHMNLGVAHAVNEGLALAKEMKAKYACIQGSDDFSTPNRLQVQADLLDNNPDIGMVGCWYDRMKWDGSERTGIITLPEEHDMLYMSLINGHCDIGYPMWRMSIHKDIGMLDEKNFPKRGSDYDFFLRVSEKFKLGMANECLYVARVCSYEYPNSLSHETNEHIMAWGKAKAMAEERRYENGKRIAAAGK